MALNQTAARCLLSTDFVGLYCQKLVYVIVTYLIIFKSSPHSAAFLRQWTRAALVQIINSLAPGGFENIFQNVFFKLISWIDTLSNSCETALRSMPQNPSDDKSTLVQVMAWCRQAASHYLSQCCPRSLSPYGVTRPQWVNGFSFVGHQAITWTSGNLLSILSLGTKFCEILIKYKTFHSWKCIWKCPFCPREDDLKVAF